MVGRGCILTNTQHFCSQNSDVNRALVRVNMAALLLCRLVCMSVVHKAAGTRRGLQRLLGAMSQQLKATAQHKVLFRMIWKASTEACVCDAVGTEAWGDHLQGAQVI